MLCRNAETWSRKSTGRCSAKQLQNFLQKCWKVLSKTTDAWSVKILRSVPQKYWDVLKSTRNTSTKVQKYWQVFCEYALKYVIQNCWEELPILTQNEQPCCENSDIGLLPCYIVVLYFRRYKSNKQLLGAKSFGNFSY